MATTTSPISWSLSQSQLCTGQAMIMDGTLQRIAASFEEVQ